MSSFNVYNTALLFSLHTVGTRGNNWRFILVINIGISLTSLHKKDFFFFIFASSLFSVYSSLKFWYWRWHGNVAENMTWQESYANFSSFPFSLLENSYNEIFYVLCCVWEEQKVFPFYATSAKGAVAFTHTHIYKKPGRKIFINEKLFPRQQQQNNNISSTDSYGVD